MITLKQLQELERAEYQTLKELQELRRDGGAMNRQSLNNTIEWQQGRWSMLCDLIEKEQ